LSATTTTPAGRRASKPSLNGARQCVIAVTDTADVVSKRSGEPPRRLRPARRVVGAEAEPQLDHAALARSQVPEQLANLLSPRRRCRQFVRRRRGIAPRIAKFAVVPGAGGLV
jgi:hypothetical protein